MKRFLRTAAISLLLHPQNPSALPGIEPARLRRIWRAQGQRSFRVTNWRMSSPRAGVTEEGLRESEHLKLSSVAPASEAENADWSMLTFVGPDGRTFGCAGHDPDAADFQAWLAHMGVSAASEDFSRRRVDSGDFSKLQAMWHGLTLLVQDKDLVDSLQESPWSFRTFIMTYSRAMRMNLSQEVDFDVEALLDAFSLDRTELGNFGPTESLEEMMNRLKKLLALFREKLPYYRNRCLACGNTENNKMLGVASYAVGDQDPAGATRKVRRLEVHQCKKCGHISTFPRSNNVTQILRARRGRCGEYSIVMHEVLRYLGYEVRLVVDWADHQWVEVLLPAASTSPRGDTQWVHCDPCEAALDEPLIYEGWGKNQTYIIAYAPTYVKDVTDVYTTNMTAAAQRRDIGQDEFESLLENATAYVKGDREDIFRA